MVNGYGVVIGCCFVKFLGILLCVVTLLLFKGVVWRNRVSKNGSCG